MNTPNIWQSLKQHRRTGSVSESLWQRITDRLDPYQQRPHATGKVETAHFADPNSKPYYVIKNCSGPAYVRLDEPGYFLWNLMDGSRTIKDLVVEYFLKFGRLGQDNILHLVHHLQRKGFLGERRRNLYALLRQKITPRSLFRRFLALRSMLFRKTYTIHGLDPVLGVLYKHGFRLLYARPVLGLYPVVLLLGLWLFPEMLRSGHYTLYHVADSSGLGFVFLIITNAMVVSIHEAAHAMTLKHFKLEAPTGGMIFYLGLPCFFVDATDAWMAPRRRRIAVALSGPISTALTASLIVIGLNMYPALPGGNVLFKVALWGYVSALINLYPLLEFDGYYVLVDLLDIPLLRRRAFSFLRRLPGKIMQHQRLDRREWLLTGYGLLAFLSTGLILLISLYVVHWRLMRIWGMMYSGQTWLFLGMMLLLTLILALPVSISLVALGAFAAVRTTCCIKNTIFGRRVSTVIFMGAAMLILLGITGGLWVPESLQPAAWSAGQILGGALTAWGGVHAWQARAGTRPGLGFLALSGLGGCAVLIFAQNLRDTALPVPGALRFLAFTAACGVVLLIVYRLRNGRPVLRPFARDTKAPSSGSGCADLFRPAWWMLGLGLGLVAMAPYMSPADDATGIGLLCAGIAFPACAMGVWAFVLADNRLVWRMPDQTSRTLYRNREHLAALFAFFKQGLMDAVIQVEGTRAWRRLADRFSEEASRLGLGPDITQEDAPAGRYGAALDLLVSLMSARVGNRVADRVLTALYDHLAWEERELADEWLLPGTAWGDRLRSVQSVTRDDLALIRATALFQDLPAQALEHLARAFRTVACKAHEIIVQEGEPGDAFYLIKSGIAAVTRSEHGAERILAHLRPGDYFGEIALLKNVPRTATVQAGTDMVVLVLERQAFDTLLRSTLSLLTKVEHGIELLQFLHPIPLFSDFSPRHLSEIMSEFRTAAYPPGTPIIRTGDESDHRFYLIKTGEVRIFREHEDHTEHVATLGTGEFFGEIALLKDVPRTATVVAATEVEVLTLDRATFDRFIKDHVAAERHLEQVASRRLHKLARETPLSPVEEPSDELLAL